MHKGINEFKKGYQPRAYVIKKHDEIGRASCRERV